MPLEKPYPPDPITYSHWNDLVDNYIGKIATLIVSADGKGDYTNIQDAVDALTDGGSIIVRGGVGDYNISEKILIDGIEKFELKGIGWPVIKSGVGMTDPHIEITNMGAYEMSRISGLYFDGIDKLRGGGIKISNSIWVDLDYNVVLNVQNHCLDILNSGLLRVFKNAFIGAGAGKNVIHHNGGSDSKFIHNEIAYGAKAMYFHGSYPDRNNISLNHIWETVDGIWSNGSRSVIHSNIIEKITGKGIYQYGSYNEILNNQIMEEGGVNPAYGIYLDATWSDDNKINDNLLKGCIVGIQIQIGSTGNSVQINNVIDCPTPMVLNELDNIVRNNVGIITENGDVATLLNGNTQIVVAHGCFYTPLAQDIDICPIETLNNATFYWFDSIDATNFTINTDVDPGQDVDFKWSLRRI